MIQKLLAEAVALLGEKVILATLKALVVGGRKAELERNKAIGKRSYRRGTK